MNQYLKQQNAAFRAALINIRDQVPGESADPDTDIAIMSDFASDALRENPEPVPNTIYADFGDAIEALKEGKRVSREGWNGKEMFVFRQVPSEIPQRVIPLMQSLPDSVKEEFVRRQHDINYSDQLALVKADSSISGWSPSVADCIAEDYIILD